MNKSHNNNNGNQVYDRDDDDDDDDDDNDDDDNNNDNDDDDDDDIKNRQGIVFLSNSCLSCSFSSPAFQAISLMFIIFGENFAYVTVVLIQPKRYSHSVFVDGAY